MTEARPRPTRRRRRRWRDYRTAAGGRPVRDFLEELTDEELAEVVAAMKEVSAEGLVAAKHLRGDLYEVKAEGPTRSFRVLFATEARFGQVLLSLSAFVKKTQKAPKQELELAEKRLSDWRARRKQRK
ncbi:MAG: type II toxin-antitoxin system RelE/ParE family toxin [Archangiaceae bacterium]|nr:type II toxin-antitoxin system RelE/ParE family toxin [Archangiaceae bacterium]